MNEGKVKIAVDLVPIIKMLYKAGIIDIDGRTQEVHCTPEFFDEAFPMYDIVPRDSEVYPNKKVAKYDGISFFSLIE